MERLLIISNRLPVTIDKKVGKIYFKTSLGGLATGLNSISKNYESQWIGWCGISSERMDENQKKEVKIKLEKNYKSYPVFLSGKEIRDFYYGFCNKTIWPLFHSFPQYVNYDKNYWTMYKNVNNLFCKALLEIIEPNDTIWIHDYHLMLLPKLIKEKVFEAKIGFFLHIPFPPLELFRLLPWRKEILEGLLESDLIGFHTYLYVQNFITNIRYLLGYEHEFGLIKGENRTIKVDSFPMGIDYDKFQNSVKGKKVQNEIKKIRKKIGERKIIFSIDRLDYTKGIKERLEAFDLFLKNYPQWREKVTFILVASPSRENLLQYSVLKKKVDELIGRINGKYGTLGWTPIWYMYRSISFKTLIALYNIADVALITPLKDGMNLIAKEYIATRTDKKGILILSEMAGSASEMGETLIVNPNDREAIVEALKEALTIPEEKKIEINEKLQNRLKRYNITRWGNDFLSSLEEATKYDDKNINLISFTNEEKIIELYQKSKHRLLLFDYDGTLVSFSSEPKKAKPDLYLLDLLNCLANEPKNDLVIVSGRDKETLEEWFKDLDVSFIAEHGAWIKKHKEEWKLLEPLKVNWKNEMRQILELYVDRTPGSFIEEKDFSLVWHYREADPELASVRSIELYNNILNLTTNLKLKIQKGNKVIEVKNVNVDKGKSVLNFLNKKHDFILAIGDDETDEDLFGILPKEAHSIKVGLEASKAKFNVPSVSEVRSLIQKLL